MSPLDGWELTLQKNIMMHKASFRTVRSDVNDDKEDTTEWANLLTRDSGEQENDEIRQKMAQMDTPTTAKRKSKDDNIVLSFTKIEIDGYGTALLHSRAAGRQGNLNARGGFLGCHSAMHVWEGLHGSSLCSL